MSATYQDLPLTNFPEDVDTFVTYMNIVASDGPLVQQYIDAMNAGNQTQANQILLQIPSASQKIIQAADLNKLSQAILAVERFYSTDVEDYITNAQAQWQNTIDQFSYMGVYASGTSYERNNIVEYTLSGLKLLYIAISDPPVGTPPTNTTYWRVLTVQGQAGESGEGLSYRGEWVSGTNYSVDDAVTYQGALWMAIQPSVNIEPSSANSGYWQLVLSLETTAYPIQASQPTNQEVGGLWFNTSDNPTDYYYLEQLENPVTADKILSGYQAYDAQGNLITGTLATPTAVTVTTPPQ